METATSQRTARFYEFGPFTVDSVKCVLHRDGKVVPLNMKAFDILLLLMQNRGEVLEKDQLLRMVWPDTVVEENNLARNISALRKALDEHPNQHEYVLTVPGRGYRFVATVRELEGPDDSWPPFTPDRGAESSIPGPPRGSPASVIDNTTVRTARGRPRPRVAALTAIIFLLCVGGLTVFLFRATSADDPPLPQHLLWQLTFDPGLQSEPTWSPDGRMIAYSSDRSGNFDIWVQPVGEGNPVRVTTSPAHDWQPDWAPEGNRLVFRSERDGGGLFVVPVLGGNERKVSSFGYHPRWSPDGSQILFYSSILQNNTVETPKIYVVGLDGKPPREVLSGFQPEFDSLRATWHPDGRRLSVWGNHRKIGWSFWTVSINGDAPVKSEPTSRVSKQLREANVSLSDFQWSPSGETLYFEGVSRSVRNIWKVGVEPTSLRWISGPDRVTNGTGRDADLALSPNGKRLAFTVRTEHTRLWLLPFDSASGRMKGGGQPITAAAVDASYPDLSHDGQKLVFRAQQAGKEELREKSLKDGHETVLVCDGLSRLRARWSRDGSRLAYSVLRPNTLERSVVVRPISGGDEQVLVATATAANVVWDWSRDGKWILAGSDRQSSVRRLLCLLPTAGAPQAEAQMRVVAASPEENLYQAHFSPDDRWITFIAARANEAGISTIYVVPADGGQWSRITEGKYFDDKPRWSSDGRMLYFISNRTGFFNVWGIRFDPSNGAVAGEPFRVTNYESPNQMILTDVRIMEMALAADRMVLPIMEVSGGIWILENVDR